jgi:hypothetical protein
MRERLRHLAAALRELLHPPFEDEDPQSTADATAARTAYIRANRPDGEVKT